MHRQMHRTDLSTPQGVLCLGADRQSTSEGSMHLAHVISDEVPKPGALALVVQLAQLPEGLHLPSRRQWVGTVAVAS